MQLEVGDRPGPSPPVAHRASTRLRVPSGCCRSSSWGSRSPGVVDRAADHRSPGGSRRSTRWRSASPWPGRSVGFVDARGPGPRRAERCRPFHLLAGVDALVAAVALAAGRKAETLHALERRAATSPPWPPSS